MRQPNPAFAQITDHRRPHLDNIKSAVSVGAHAGETLAAGKVPGLDQPQSGDIAESNRALLNGESKPKAWEPTTEQKDAQTNRHLRSSITHQSAWDAGMHWGRSGAVEVSPDRGAVSMPSGAEASTGFGSPMSSATTSTIPSTLGADVRPVSGSGAQGNQNMGQIAAYKIG